MFKIKLSSFLIHNGTLQHTQVGEEVSDWDVTLSFGIQYPDQLKDVFFLEIREDLWEIPSRHIIPQPPIHELQEDIILQDPRIILKTPQLLRDSV